MRSLLGLRRTFQRRSWPTCELRTSDQGAHSQAIGRWMIGNCIAWYCCLITFRDGNEVDKRLHDVTEAGRRGCTCGGRAIYHSKGRRRAGLLQHDRRDRLENGLAAGGRRTRTGLDPAIGRRHIRPCPAAGVAECGIAACSAAGLDGCSWARPICKAPRRYPAGTCRCPAWRGQGILRVAEADEVRRTSHRTQAGGVRHLDRSLAIRRRCGYAGQKTSAQRGRQW
jgi:hypothetical protein